MHDQSWRWLSHGWSDIGTLPFGEDVAQVQDGLKLCLRTDIGGVFEGAHEEAHGVYYPVFGGASGLGEV